VTKAGRDGFVSTWIRAGALTAVVDGVFSSVLSAVFYGSTVTRLFQGVAATLVGAKAFEGGTPTALLGVLMHVGVALWWSAVFGLIGVWSAWVRRVLHSPLGVVKVASLYGPAVWVVMSLAVIPSLMHRPTPITFRWWVQFVGHAPFVGGPIAWSFGRGGRRDW
jgi:hypothetical protein